MQPYQPPPEIDDPRPRPWWVASNGVAVLIAICVVATVFLAFVDWKDILL